MISFPCASSARALASTSKAVSVPKRLIASASFTIYTSLISCQCLALRSADAIIRPVIHTGVNTRYTSLALRGAFLSATDWCPAWAPLADGYPHRRWFVLRIGWALPLMLMGILVIAGCTAGQPEMPTPPPAPVDKVIFMANHEGNDDIYIVGADGSDAVNLTKSPHDDVPFSWSPDGRQILFVSDR